jgi:streptogramin lyase
MNSAKLTPHTAEVVREYGPFDGIDRVNGVTFDGHHVWLATGDTLMAIDPVTGAVDRRLPVAAHAGTAFDGRHLWQIAGDRIHKIDPESGEVVSSLPAPAQGRDSGLTWAEGTLWVGEYRARVIHQIDATTGAVLRTIESDRFVTGVSWLDGELWHGAVDDQPAELRRIDPTTGAVVESVTLPAGVMVSGLEASRDDVLYCGGGSRATVLAVRKPRAKR